MNITKIERSTKNKKMLMVYIDHEYSFSISEDDYLAMNLYEKREISFDELEYIKNTLMFKRAKAKGIKYLALKLRTKRQLIEKLEDYEFDMSTIQKVTKELTSMGYINDRLYAQKFISDRIKFNPKSKRLLKLELTSKGIDERLIDDVLNEYNLDELELIERLIRKKFSTLNLSDKKNIKKIYTFLLYRGFSSELVFKSLNRLKKI